MDFSFYSNIFITLTGLAIAASLWKRGNRSFFLGFFVFTGLSSLFGAYGHLESNPVETSANLLLISRLLSILAMYYFARATLALFNLYTFKPAKSVNAITPLVLVALLIARNSFSPVMIYGVLSLALLGTITFSINYKKYPRVSFPMIVGITFLVSAAILFGFKNEISIFKPSDISHILVALSLSFMAIGVKNTSRYELEA